MWRKTGLMGGILGLALVAGTARGDLVIDTYTGWDNTTKLYPFGFNMEDDINSSPTGIEWMGQTFTVGEQFTVLEKFSFWVKDAVVDVAFNAHVYGWDSDTAQLTGSSLFSGNNSATDGNFVEFSFFPDLDLDAGTYIAFLEATSGYDGEVGARSDNPYAGGAAYYLNNPSPTNVTWSEPTGDYDFAFVAELGSPDPPTIPEPASFALFGLGCVCMTLLRRQRLRHIDK
jgi:hypothetical protein